MSSILKKIEPSAFTTNLVVHMRKKRSVNNKDYARQTLNVRFLKAVDKILEANKEKGVSPDSERSLSLLISSDSSTIAQIRRGRSVTLYQVQCLGRFFNLDFNYFFKESMPIRYEIYADSEGKPYFNNTPTFEEEFYSAHLMLKGFETEVAKMEQNMIVFHDELVRIKQMFSSAPQSAPDIVTQLDQMENEALNKLSTLIQKFRTSEKIE